MATTVDGSGVTTDNLKVSSPNVPATPSSAGEAGDIAWDIDYFYICISNNNWARVKHSTDWAAL